MARRKHIFVSAYLNTYTELGIIGEDGNSTIFRVKDEDNKEYALVEERINRSHDEKIS